jgi:signal transduction histidine kinase/ligand-binding sensor domain-containing protein
VPVALDPPRAELLVAAEDRAGGLWLGGRGGLARLAGGRLEPVPLPAGAGNVRALLADDRGRLWAGAEGGLWLLAPRAGGGFTAPLAVAALSGRRVRSLHRGADGTLWVGAIGGLHALAAGDPLAPARRYTVAHGLRDETVNAMVEDRAGNLWRGTVVGGVIRLVQGGLVTFDTADGLGHTTVVGLFEGRDGTLHVVSEIGGWISRFDGDRFTAAHPRFAPALAARLPRTPTRVVQDRAGEWWVAIADELFRFAATDRVEALGRSAPRARYGVEDGLAGRPVSLWAGDGGDLWIGTAPGPRGALTRWRRAEERFEALGPAAGLPESGEPTAFHLDPDGRRWLGWSTGELLSGRDGRFAAVPLPAGAAICAIHRDRAGRLWVATCGTGVLRADDPGSAAPHWRRLDAGSGLASDNARCLTSDLEGRIYVGTDRGVDRVDPRTGEVRHYSTADGLAQLETTIAFRDRTGALWFGTYGGLSRLVPGPEPSRRPLPTWIGALAVDDVALPVPALGATSLGPVALAAGRHRVRIDYFAPAFAPGEPLRYRYRLTGRDGADWSPPTEQRSVVYADLGAGRHRFAVQAVDGGGTASAEAATVTFVVPPPWWRRAWFLAAAALALAALAFALHRLRLARALALERVRTRIAADLHDDLGASLSRISLLAEVARSGGEDPRRSGVLDQIGDTARGLTGRAREIVWSLDPRYDDLASLTVRVREAAGELLDPIGVGWSFDAPAEAEVRRLRLRPEQRQHLLLVYKEALHNAARHAGAGRVELKLAVRGPRLEGEIRDDGRGLAGGVAAAAADGNGLVNMAARVRALGGELTVDSPPGAGVRLAFSVPLTRRPGRTNMRLPSGNRSL